jgi:enolase
MFVFSSKFNIDKIHGYEILDSRGFPTVACEITLKNGLKGKAMVPSGASTGVSEAIELRDNDKNRFNGKGVLNAVNNINNILAPYLYNCDPTKQSYIDKKMIEIDGTPNKSKLGANAILAVSLACANVSAKIKGLELYEYIRRFILKDKYDVYTMPLPMLNVVNGGAHANNSLDFQEFMFVPVGAKNFRNALRISSECFYSLQKILIEKKQSTGKGDEGGFAPNLKNHVDALELMTQAIKQAGYHPGVNKDVAIALDCAASELYDQSTKKYIFSKAIANKVMDNTLGQNDSSQMIAYLKTLVEKFPIISIEDGLAESD